MGRLFAFSMVVGSLLGCDDDELPPYAEDLMGDCPGCMGTGDGVADMGPLDAAAVDGSLPPTCTPVEGGLVNAITFDDPAQEFAPRTAFARYRPDCAGPLEVVLTEDALCRSGGNRELRITVSGADVTGTTLDVSDPLSTMVTFTDADRTAFTNSGGCAVSSGSVRLDSFDLSEAGNPVSVSIEAAQLFDCAGARTPLTLTGSIDALLDQTFAVACPP